MTITISKHFTKKAAHRRANELNKIKPLGKSSGWKQFNYSVKSSASLFRKWRVVTRHVR